MWKLAFVLALPLAPLASAHSVAPPSHVKAEAQAGPQCLIEARPSAGAIQLQGIVASAAPVSGTYQFVVRKTGPAGTSNSAQSGTFEAHAGSEVVGDVGLGLEPGASYEAELVLKWNGGKASCTATGPNRAGLQD